MGQETLQELLAEMEQLKKKIEAMTNNGNAFSGETYNAKRDLPAGNVQPIDVFALVFSPLGYKDVYSSYNNLVIVSAMCNAEGLVVSELVDVNGIIGEKNRTYNGSQLNSKFKAFSRGSLDLNISPESVDALIKNAREREIVFAGDYNPYNPNVY